MNDSAEVLACVEQALRRSFSVVPTRASISFLGVEPIEVLNFAAADVYSYVTLGMSRRAMTPSDALSTTDAGPRAELLVQTRGAGGELWRRLSVLAAAPTVEGVVFIEGMTVDLGLPLDHGSSCTGALIVTSALAAISTPVGPVQVLRLLPATSTELAWSRVHGSVHLQERWHERATDLLDLARRSVDLA